MKDQQIFKDLEDSDLGKIIQALEGERDANKSGYKAMSNGGNGTLRFVALDENQEASERSVVYHTNGHGYCNRVLVFNTPASGEGDSYKSAVAVTRHYHQVHNLKIRVMNSQMKATPTDCDIEGIGTDVLAFLKSGTLPKTLQLG